MKDNAGQTIHASCVALGGKGILLLGQSGAGKSDLALQLIDGGAKLVADDRCALFGRAGKLWARVPDSIAGMIEVRGIGILALPHARTAHIVMAAQLTNQLGPRLPKPAFYIPPPELKSLQPVPLITLNGRHAGAAARIRMALAAFSANRFRDTFNPNPKQTGNI